MTDRNMNSSLVTETEKQVVQYHELIYMNLDGGVYMTTAPFDITYDNNTYLKDLGLLSFGDIAENAAFEIEKLSFSLNSDSVIGDIQNPIVRRVVDPSFDYIDKEVKIWRAYYERHTLVGVVELYFGYITSMNVASGLTSGSSSVTFETSSHWATFDSTSGRFTNKQSQSLDFSGDLGFDYASQIQKQISWKEEL